MIVDRARQWLFVSNPKTGTHTMYDYLTTKYNGIRTGGFHERKIPDHLRGMFTFTTVRDPLERLVAAWNSLLFQPDYRPIYLEKIGSDSFGAFVDWLTSHNNQTEFKGKGSPVLCLQSVWLKPAMQDIEVYIPIEFVNMAFDYLPFAEKNNVLPVNLKREHASYKELETELNIDQIDNLESWLEPDFELYDEAMNQMSDIIEVNIL